jgi:hypothetical protein
VLGLTVGAAKNIAIVIVVGIIALAVLSAWLVRNITAKVVMVLLFAGIALGVWTQRSSLDDCADRVKANPTAGATCTFFGTDVRVPGV